MAIFGKRKDEEEYDEEYEDRPRRIRDLKPQNRKKRKEPLRPWGKKERYIVLAVLLITVLTAAILAASARDFKLPGLPKINFSFKNPFGEQIVIVGNKKDKSEDIIQDFEDKTKSLSGTYALYVIDLSSGDYFGIDEDRVMQAASLIKLPVMLFVEGRVEDSKLEAMGKRSDNAVFNEMVKKFGESELESYIGSLGMKNTSILENETTPKEIGDLLKKIYDGKNEKILGFLTDTIFEDWLVKGVPEGLRVAHKYGREIHVVNDAGVVFAQKPYVVVIMTQGVVEKEADSVFPELSKLVYDGMSK